MSQALSGVRVLDLSRVLAGPWATQILGDLGAEIIKVEKPDGGDDTRSWGPPWFGQGNERQSAYFLCANRNKKSIAIDISSSAGQDLVRALALNSDVVVENFKVGQLARYGLDYPSLHALNPRLVYCSITGFGQTGPRAAQAGYDFMIQGLCGLMHVTGEPSGDPQKVGVALVDVMTGLYAAIGILAAINQRHVTGRGQYIDLSLFDVSVATLANQALNYLVSGSEPRRLGNAHPNVVPYQAFQTADGFLILAIGNDAQFRRFAEISGRRDLANDVRFRSNETRVAHRAVLINELAVVMRSRTSKEWMDLLGPSGIPHGPINQISEALADPQAVYRGLTQSVHGVPGIASPLRMSEASTHKARPPPLLNEHFREVLETVLGLAPSKMEQIRNEQSGAD